jgi:uncharacterized membrane protein
MEIAIQLFVTVFAPLIILIYQKNKIVSFLSPVVICYIVGIILGNLPGFSLNKSFGNTLAQISVPLAIPLLLISTQLVRWMRLAKSTIMSFSFIVIAVLVATTVITLFFKEQLPNYWQLAGMMVGVYTGGTPNMSAIGMSLGVNEEAFILINGADIVVSAIYLLFVLTIGFRLMGLILPAFKSTGTSHSEEFFTNWDRLPYSKRLGNIVILLLTASLCVGVSVGLSRLLFGKDVVAFIMLMITSLGILLSLSQKVQSLQGSYEIGQYLLLIFCVAIGSLANINEMASGSLIYITYCSSIMFLAVMLHMLLCYLFKIDRDTAVITSVAGIFGPPFVGPMANALKNPEVIVSGLTSGLVGYAVGNYLGIAMAYFIQSL